MKLVGELKKQVEETNNKEEAKEIIENAGMQLSDDELDSVTGGFYFQKPCNHVWKTKFDSVANKMV